MKKFLNTIIKVTTIVLSLSLHNTTVAKEKRGVIQLDLQGNALWSRYNFTDLKKPYDDGDAYAVAKVAFWLDKKRSLGPYIQGLVVGTTAEEFWWQRHTQIEGGLQWYPLSYSKKLSAPYIKALRLFAVQSHRNFYDKPKGIDTTEDDCQVGLDYYYDNLFDKSKFAILAFTNAAYRCTNFSFEDYKAFVWTGNIKTGFKFRPTPSTIIPYFVIDWTSIPKYDDRWFENFLRAGVGIRWYPNTTLQSNFTNDLLRRLNISVEALHNFAWFADGPSSKVERTDYRLNLNFSTGGFYRD